MSVIEGVLGGLSIGAGSEGGPPSVFSSSQRSASEPPGSADDFAARVRSWYLEAVNSRLWKDFRAKGDESEAFYVGGKGQWGIEGKYDDYEKLKQQKRYVVSINHIAPVVDVMSGYERSNRMDIKATPQGDQDVDGAQLMTWFLKYAQDQTQTADTISEMFENGNIRGMDVADVGVDYTGDRPVNGEIAVSRFTPGRDWLCDPHFTRYDLTDARYCLRFKWAFLLDLIAEYPEHEQELREGAGHLREIFRTYQTHEGHTASRRGDNYGYVRNHPVESLDEESSFYGPSDERMLIIEAWYHVYYTKYAVFDKSTGKVTDCATAQEARTLKESDPANLRIHRTESRRVRMATVIPATYVTIEEDKNPYPNDDTNYPFVPYIAKRKGDIIYGVVENLKDPQRVENKRWSQVCDVLAKWAYMRPMVPKGSVLNPAKLNDASDDSPIEYDKDRGEPGWWVAPVSQVTGALEVLAKQMDLNIKTISGINTDLLGQKADTASGVAIARRQQQGQIIATVYFDNLRKTRRLIGQRLARRVQQVYTTEDTVRLTGDYGESVLVRINPKGADGTSMSDADYKQFAQAQAGAGKPKILRDVQSLKFDIVVSEAPTTPTARAAALMSLLEIAEKVPALIPDLIDFIVELSDVPDRAMLLQRVRARMGGGGQAPGNPAGQPEAPGTPPGQPPRPSAGAPPPPSAAPAAAA